MLYSLLRPLLFKLPPETAHCVSFYATEKARKMGLLPNRPIACKSREVMGLDFPNPVGLAAGLDKNGDQHEQVRPPASRIRSPPLRLQ